MKVWRSARPANFTYFLTPGYALSPDQSDAGRVKVSIEGIDFASIFEGMLDDNGSFVFPPAIGMSVSD
jgi:hypothetical protein